MNNDTNCDEVENRLDIQIVGPDVARTIHVEVFGPFGLHQDEQKGRFWWITHLPSGKNAYAWKTRGAAIAFISALRALPIMWHEDRLDVRPFLDDIYRIRDAILNAENASLS
jgi:hypothetical protein